MAQGFLNGYFHDGIDKKMPFDEFAMQWGRQYGAYVMARDEPATAPLPDDFWEVSQYTLDALARAEAEIERLKVGPDAFREEYEQAMESERERVAKKLEEIDAQLALLRQWETAASRLVAPTPDHAGAATASQGVARGLRANGASGDGGI